MGEISLTLRRAQVILASHNFGVYGCLAPLIRVGLPFPQASRFQRLITAPKVNCAMSKNSPCHFSAIAVVFAFLASVIIPLHASVGFQPVNPDELKMTSEPKAPGAQAIILFREVSRDDSPRTAHEDDYFRHSHWKMHHSATANIRS